MYKISEKPTKVEKIGKMRKNKQERTGAVLSASKNGTLYLYQTTPESPLESILARIWAILSGDPPA